MILEQYDSITVEAGSVGETGFPCLNARLRKCHNSSMKIEIPVVTSA